MSIFDAEDENFKEIREKIANNKRMISRLDVTEAIGDVVSSALSTMVLSNDAHFANLIAAINAKKSLDKLFPEESRDEEKKDTEGVPDTKQEPDKQSDDLKHLLFKEAAFWSSPSKIEIEDHRTAEIRRSAKQTTLFSLIWEAGLSNEYNEWRNENGHDF